MNKRRLLILMYHMISETEISLEKRYATSPAKFRRQMSYLKYAGFTPVTPDDIHLWMTGGSSSLPEKPVVITFDDAYMDNYENALPILQKFRFPATVFVVSGYVGKTNAWDLKHGISEKRLMGWNEIREMHSNGVTIGAHTTNHPRLTEIPAENALLEISECKFVIEKELDAPVHHFAYPHGDRNESVIEMVRKAGYRTSFSTKSGFNNKETSIYELRRIEVYGTDMLWQFALKLKYGTNTMDAVLPLKYYFSRVKERFF